MALRLACTLFVRRGGVATAHAASEALIAQACIAARNVSLPSATPAGIKHISTSFPSFSSGLSSILGEEVKYERDNYVPDEIISKGPPAPFTLTEEEGDTLLTLTRKYNGEEVVVSCMANDQPPPDEEDENNSVEFTVTVNKGDQSLVFETVSDGTYLQVLHVSCEPKDGIQSGSGYTGPVFDELDDNLKEEFAAYLEQRGIDLNLADYLRHLIHDKEQKEYMSWLQKVQKFVS